MKIILIVLIASQRSRWLGTVILAQSGNDLFQQALVKERTEGNLPEAIKLYQTIVDKHGSDRKLAAKSLVPNRAGLRKARQRRSPKDLRANCTRIRRTEGNRR